MLKIVGTYCVYGGQMLTLDFFLILVVAALTRGYSLLAATPTLQLIPEICFFFVFFSFLFTLLSLYKYQEFNVPWINKGYICYGN